MALLMKRKSLIFNEAEDDETTSDAGTDSGSEGETPADTAEDTADQGAEDTEQSEETPEENPEEDEKIDGDQTEEEENNFDVDSEPEEGEEDDGSDTGSDSDSSTDDGSGDDSETDTDSEEKQIDRDMFETLSEAEKRQKIATLKKLFLNLYKSCDMIIDRYDTVIGKYENISQIGKRVILTLYDLKAYIGDYLIQIFDSKSYIENDIMFNRCLSVLNGIKMVTKDVVKLVEEQEK